MFQITSTFYKYTAAVSTQPDDKLSQQQTAKKQMLREHEQSEGCTFSVSNSVSVKHKGLCV